MEVPEVASLPKPSNKLLIAGGVVVVVLVALYIVGKKKKRSPLSAVPNIADARAARAAAPSLQGGASAPGTANNPLQTFIGDRGIAPANSAPAAPAISTPDGGANPLQTFISTKLGQ